MASAPSLILQDIVSALRSSGEFQLVTLGRVDDETRIPRAHVLCEGQDVFQSDDTPASQWARLRVRIVVRTRSASDGDGLSRAHDLCESARESLLSDVFRNQQCRDLPIGRATEIGSTEVVGGMKQPVAEMAFDVRCHFEIEDES